MTEPPLHGYRGDTLTPAPPLKPRGLTLALTREAGGRGTDIARAVAEKLGWQVFGQELLDQLVNDSVARDELMNDLPAGVSDWADLQLARLMSNRRIVPSSLAAETGRLLFALAARGKVVVIGRGAGFILPADSTLHVRIIAPRAERIRYLGDWMRLPSAEADVEVRVRDEARDTFLKQLHDGDPHDPLLYDITLNSSRLGVQACARIITRTIKKRRLNEEVETDVVEPA